MFTTRACRFVSAKGRRIGVANPEIYEATEGLKARKINPFERERELTSKSKVTRKLARARERCGAGRVSITASGGGNWLTPRSSKVINTETN